MGGYRKFIRKDRKIKVPNQSCCSSFSVLFTRRVRKLIGLFVNCSFRTLRFGALYFSSVKILQGHIWNANSTIIELVLELYSTLAASRVSLK